MRVFIVLIVIAMSMTQSAYSQTKLEADKIRAERDRKEIEAQHKATMERLPNQKKKSDPWQDLRNNEGSSAPRGGVAPTKER
jgi:hypothetical protein